jgi:anti-sigma factor RsiW
VTSVRPISEAELHAYLDGALPRERTPEVEAYIEGHPAVAARVEAWRQQRRLLRDALGPIAEEPIPPELNVAALVEARRLPRPTGLWRIAAACLLALGVGAAGGWGLRGATAPAPVGVAAVGQEAAESYRVYAADPDRPVELGAEHREQLVRWVSQRLRRPVAPPDLESAGYRLLGGRLAPTAYGPAAVFIYQGSGGSRIAVLVRPMAVEKTAKMREHSYGAVGGVSWAEDGLGYGLVGAESPSELHPLADQIRSQIRQSAVS